MIRLPLIAAVTAGLLIGLLPPATAAASPTPTAAATSSKTMQSASPNAHGQPNPPQASGQDSPRIPIGTPISVTAVAANLRLLPTILGNVDRHR
jgi:hypothetical protein